MSEDSFPITPPPELVQQWFLSARAMPVDQWVTDVATQAARWGADEVQDWYGNGSRLRTTRRPKPPSLKEQAVFAAAVLRSPDETCSIAEIEQHWHTIRCALDSLPD